MTTNQDAIDAATNVIRDDLMRINPDQRALVLDMIIRANNASASHYKQEALRQAALQERNRADQETSATVRAVFNIAAERMEHYADELEKNE